jgi:DNA replication protein DnaC
MSPEKKFNEEQLCKNIEYLKLNSIMQNYNPAAKDAASSKWTYPEYLSRLLEGEVDLRKDRSVERRIRMARFPVIKTLDEFNWSWPKKINRLQVQDLFRLKFVEEKGNIIFIGTVGLGKTHLAVALGYHACHQGLSVLFASAIDIVNTLTVAQNAGRLKLELKKYLRPSILIVDELGYLPVNKKGADLLFQVISHRYEQGAIILTTNKPFKKWPEIFDNDATLTSAVLDRMLHHAESVLIEGPSYRMKDRIDS